MSQLHEYYIRRRIAAQTISLAVQVEEFKAILPKDEVWNLYSDAIVWHRGLKTTINKTIIKKKFEAINLGIRKLFKKIVQKRHFLPFQKWQTNQFINSI